MRRETLAVLTFLVLSLTTVSVHASSIKVGPNIDVVSASERQQAETTIAIDLRNPSIIVVGAQDHNLQSDTPTACCSGHRWNGYFRSTDDGLTWSFSRLPGFPGDTSVAGMTSPLRSFDLTSDPILAFDRAGNVYYAGIALKIAPFSVVAFVAKYTNDGATYAGVTTIGPPNNLADKPWIAVDTSGGANDGNVYMVYSQGFTRSTDGGQTFSNPITVPGNGGQESVTVDPTGNVFVLSLLHSSTNNILVTKSVDGGATFRMPVVAAAGVVFLPFMLPGNQFRTFSLPQIAADSAGVFVVWDDFRTGDANVMFVRSLDAGVTWSNPLVINDVTTGQQFFPTLAATGGTINVAWYDSRLGQLANGTITGLDVFYARSTDEGASFSKNVRVTSVSFNPNLVKFVDFNRNGPFIGDYNQIVATPTEAHLVWSDTRNACDFVDPFLGCIDQDPFTATINL